MKFYLVISVLLLSATSFSQSKSISFSKKIKAPYVTINNDTIKVNDRVFIKEGTTPEGNFKYIQSLNTFNEPIKAADSRMAFKKQEVLFFKEQDGTMYAFTKYFVINIEAALQSKELEIFKKE